MREQDLTERTGRGKNQVRKTISIKSLRGIAVGMRTMIGPRGERMLEQGLKRASGGQSARLGKRCGKKSARSMASGGEEKGGSSTVAEFWQGSEKADRRAEAIPMKIVYSAHAFCLNGTLCADRAST